MVIISRAQNNVMMETLQVAMGVAQLVRLNLTMDVFLWRTKVLQIVISYVLLRSLLMNLKLIIQ